MLPEVSARHGKVFCQEAWVISCAKDCFLQPPGELTGLCLLQGDGSQITVEPGLIGGEINRILARHKAKHNHPIQYKIGPDPSSIDSCMVGGMVSNNSSGMCCGVSQNTYHTLKDMRIVFLDGTVLDTADPDSREAFMQVAILHPFPVFNVRRQLVALQACVSC